MIVDLIILALIGICVFLGAKRGLVLSLISALSLVIALTVGYFMMPAVGGILERTPLADSTEKMVYTYISDAVSSEEGYEKALEQSEMPTFLKEKVVDILTADQTQEVADYGIRKAANMVSELAVKVVSVLIVTILTFVILASMKSIWRKFREKAELRRADTIGGVVFGLCQGVLFVSVAMLALSILGMAGFGGSLVDTVQASYIGGFLYSHNFLGIILTLFIG